MVVVGLAVKSDTITHPRKLWIKMFTVRLERVRQLSQTTRDFAFVRLDGQAVEYQPGQFFRFEFEDADGSFERSYSLCNYDELYGSRLDLVISEVDGGRATRLLFADDIEGLTARVSGPFGRLVLPEQAPGRLLMVATSVGLAPYMPILKSLEPLDYGKVVLLLGVRDRSEFLYGSTLVAYAERHPWLELRLSLSREQAVQEYEFDGYVNQQLTDLDPDPDHDHVLLCGNPGMIDVAWSALQADGFRAKQVVREKYVFGRETRAASSSLTEEQKGLIQEKLNKYS